MKWLKTMEIGSNKMRIKNVKSKDKDKANYVMI